jgi:hypothetical protein
VTYYITATTPGGLKARKAIILSEPCIYTATKNDNVETKVLPFKEGDVVEFDKII